MSKFYNLILSFVAVFVIGCSSLEFDYSELKSVKNIIYNKTSYTLMGEDLPSANLVFAEIIGVNIENLFELNAKMQEKITKRAIETNQVATKRDYLITIEYRLSNKTNGCDVYFKKISTRFSFTPKSSGYNFGSDQSLNQLYKLALKENLNDFLGSLKNLESLSSCINEN